eukprot:1578431-Rhodomonas_salina.1
MCGTEVAYAKPQRVRYWDGACEVTRRIRLRGTEVCVYGREPQTAYGCAVLRCAYTGASHKPHTFA